MFVNNNKALLVLNGFLCVRPPQAAQYFLRDQSKTEQGLPLPQGNIEAFMNAICITCRVICIVNWGGSVATSREWTIHCRSRAALECRSQPENKARQLCRPDAVELPGANKPWR